MQRRDLLKSAALIPALGCLDFRAQAADDQSVNFPYAPAERLDQGPFGIEQDQGWQTILFTTPSEKPLRNPGFGLVGYTWEESGPSLAARAGGRRWSSTWRRSPPCRSSMSFTFVAIGGTCNPGAGRLDLDPVWALTLDAASGRDFALHSESAFEHFVSAGGGRASGVSPRSNSPGQNRPHPRQRWRAIPGTSLRPS